LNEINATSSVHNKGADTGMSIKERMAIARQMKGKAKNDKDCNIF